MLWYDLNWEYAYLKDWPGHVYVLQVDSDLETFKNRFKIGFTTKELEVRINQ